jgi:tetratricopeptide (TPR) repeat protein
MVAKKRIRKHDLKEDHFVTAAFQLSSYVREHKNIFFIAIAGLVVLVIALTMFTSSRSHKQESAARIVGEVSILYQQGDYQATIQQCQALLDQFSNTKQASIAVILLADSHFKMGQYQDAISAYNIYIEKYHRDKLFEASSLTGIAACHEYLDQFADAGEFYMRAAEEFPEFYGAPESLLNAGRCFFAAGDNDRAREAYSNLTSSYPDSRYAKDAIVASAELGEI